MATLVRIAPIFGVRDVDASLALFERLGFTTRLYEGGDYGYASRDGVELHLGFEAAPTRTSAYLSVDDADELARTWLAAGGDVRMPEDTEWGQREGVLIDLDDNVIRFGSPLRER